MPEPLTNAERQRRHRARQRLEADPVRRYLKAVIAWDETRATPASGRLAVTASKLMESQERGPVQAGQKTIAELMRVWTPPTGRAVYTATESSKVALAALERALVEMEGEGGPSERSVAAGLAHCKHLILAPAQRADAFEVEALHAMRLATLGANGGLAPSHLIVYADDPADGPSAAPEENV